MTRPATVAAERSRLTYLVSHPIQYQVPLFRKLAGERTIHFKALFGSDFGLREQRDPGFGQAVDFGIDLLGGYAHEFLPSAEGRPVDRFLSLRYPMLDLPAAISQTDVFILHGWRTLMLWQAAGHARRNHKPYFIRAEAPQLGAQQHRPLHRRLVWQLLVGNLVRGAAGVLALGRANTRFYESLRVSGSRIHFVPYFVDNEAVRAAAAMARESRAAWRLALEIPADAFVLVAVGKLMARKRPGDLLEILRRLPADVYAVWVGSGEMMDEMQRRAEAMGVQSRVRWVGFRPARETWSIIARCDLFVHLAEAEPWGLVVNEALAAGVPILVSKDTGAAEDLVADPTIGDVLPVGEIEAWTASILRWRAARNQGEHRSAQVNSILRRYSVETACQGIVDAVCGVSANRHE